LRSIKKDSFQLRQFGRTAGDDRNNITNRINRATFDAGFFVAALDAMSVENLRLRD
jgi:hypothetical protein